MSFHLHIPSTTPAATGFCTKRWVPVRTLHRGHLPQMCSHLLALSDEDRIWRFGHRASDEHIRRYITQFDFDRDRFFGTFDRRLSLLALGHLALDRGTSTAEFAVSVLPRARGRGLGTHLFEHAVTHARHLGLPTLVLHLAHDNAPMLAIVQRAGALIDFAGGDTTAELPLQGETLGSRIGAMLDRQAAEIDFRIKRHALRVDRLLPDTGAPPDSWGG